MSGVNETGKSSRTLGTLSPDENTVSTEVKEDSSAARSKIKKAPPLPPRKKTPLTNRSSQAEKKQHTQYVRLLNCTKGESKNLDQAIKLILAHYEEHQQTIEPEFNAVLNSIVDNLYEGKEKIDDPQLLKDLFHFYFKEIPLSDWLSGIRPPKHEDPGRALKCGILLDSLKAKEQIPIQELGRAFSNAFCRSPLGRDPTFLLKIADILSREVSNRDITHLLISIYSFIKTPESKYFLGKTYQESGLDEFDDRSRIKRTNYEVTSDYMYEAAKQREPRALAWLENEAQKEDLLACFYLKQLYTEDKYGMIDQNKALKYQQILDQHSYGLKLTENYLKKVRKCRITKENILNNIDKTNQFPESFIYKKPSETQSIDPDKLKAHRQKDLGLLQKSLHSQGIHLSSMDAIEILDHLYQKFPYFEIPDQEYSADTLSLFLTQRLALWIDDQKKYLAGERFGYLDDVQKREKYAPKIDEDNEDLQKLQTTNSGRIPFSQIIADDLYFFNPQKITEAKEFLLGKSTYCSAGVGNSINMDIRPRRLMLDSVQAGDTFLTIGDGVGAQTYGLLGKGAKVIMNDADAYSIVLSHKAMSSLKEEEKTSVNLEKQLEYSYGFFPDSTKGYPDNSLDGIVCNHVLHYMNPEQIEAFYTEAFRLLKPGGTLHVLNLSPFHINFSYYTPTALQKLKEGERWPSIMENTGALWHEITDLPDEYHFSRPLPPNMYPQFAEKLSSEAEDKGFLVQESGYTCFSDDKYNTSDSQRSGVIDSILFRKELENLAFDLPSYNRGIAYVIAVKPEEGQE